MIILLGREKELLRQAKTKRIQQNQTYPNRNIERSSLNKAAARIYRKEKSQLESKSLK